MKPQDLKVLKTRLDELAAYFDKREPTAAALKVWNDALEECQLDDVLCVLTDWPKSHRQMPLADEVLKLCRSLLSARVERQAEIDRNNAGTLAELVAGLRDNLSPQSAMARDEIRCWAQVKRNLSPKAWARKLKERESAGEVLSDVQRLAWREALRESFE